MKTITANSNLIAFCGLYCGACKAYLNEKCPGCRENAKATWCQVRACGLEHKYKSCADCADFKNAADCKKMNNFISKVFALILRSDRPGCIKMIKNNGPAAYACYMAENKLQSLKRK